MKYTPIYDNFKCLKIPKMKAVHVYYSFLIWANQTQSTSLDCLTSFCHPPPENPRKLKLRTHKAVFTLSTISSFTRDTLPTRSSSLPARLAFFIRSLFILLGCLLWNLLGSHLNVQTRTRIYNTVHWKTRSTPLINIQKQNPLYNLESITVCICSITFTTW